MEWTTYDVELLKGMYSKNIKVSEIAESLNRTPKAIRNKAYMLKITNPVLFTEEEKRYVVDNYKSHNLKEIAKYLGREDNYRNVCRLAKNLGLDMTGKKKEFPDGYVDENGVYHKNGWVRKTDEEIAATKSVIMKEWHKENEHPKGMLGKNHSEEFKQKTSDRVKEDWKNMDSNKLKERGKKQRITKIKNGTLKPKYTHKNPYSRARGGKREDLDNTYFRSSWEANIARYYNYKNIKWWFEPKTFVFQNIKSGSVSYTPDFYLPGLEKWVEVKGWMDSKSKAKLKRFQKQYPVEFSKLELITQKEYKEISKEKHLIPFWED